MDFLKVTCIAVMFTLKSQVGFWLIVTGCVIWYAYAICDSLETLQ
jgi:hypothetical protein